MGYLIIIGICVLIGFLSGFFEFFGGFLEGIAYALFGLVVGCIFSLLLGGVLTNTLDYKEELIEENEIINLKDNSGASGSFFLGSGYIDDELNYYYMIKTKRGSKLEKANAEISYVNEDNSINPKVKKYDRVFENSFIQKIFPRLSFEYVYEFTIPKDSILKDFNIDLE